MSSQEQPKGFFSSAFVGICVVIATVVVVGGVFIFLLMQQAH
ncbi:MAG TPA: hypothetical protein VHM70_23535 [Polyangiaceae bacterium]|jgi:hypothetical protein|nr:hypothetical protein [Polyangiaceae bacterium]